MRTIITPPTLPPAALAELKLWLGITTTRDDAPLLALLRAGLESCEAFIGILPLETECEEVLPAQTGWRRLTTRPVQAITSLWSVPAEGARVALAADAYAIDLDTDGAGRIRAISDTARIAVRFTAGLAPDWNSLPESLRHGVLRIAAHQHRTRESEGAGQVPPPAVIALWRPWRRMRLA